MSFRCPVIIVTIYFEADLNKLVSGKKAAFLDPKTVRRVTKRPPTGKPKLSRVTSGYGGLMIPLRRVSPDTDEDHEDDEEDLTDVTPTQIELITFFTIIAN